MEKYHPLERPGAPRHRGPGHRQRDEEQRRRLRLPGHHPQAGADFISERFPNIYQTCLEYGIDITKEPIPVVPAAHYLCGGVVSTSTARRDHARHSTPSARSPAPACTGPTAWPAIPCWRRWCSLPGRPGAPGKPCRSSTSPTPPWSPPGTRGSATNTRRNGGGLPQLGRNPPLDVGLRGHRAHRQAAAAGPQPHRPVQQEIHEYYWNFIITSDLLELRNIATVAELIIAMATTRKESRGLHYTLDYPERDDVNFKRDSLLSSGGLH